MRTKIFRALPLLALTAFAACSDLGLDGGADQVAGLTIEDASGNELVRVGSTGSVSGTLSVSQGDDRDLEVVLRDASGGAVSTGLSESVRITILDSTIASWSDTGTTSGTLVGKRRGSTTLRVDVISAGSITYGSPAIPIRVN